MVKFRQKIKPKFWRFQGLFYLEGQGPGSAVFELVRGLYVINTWLRFEDKIENT